jgi:hypothetical protein
MPTKIGTILANQYKLSILEDDERDDEAQIKSITNTTTPNNMGANLVQSKESLKALINLNTYRLDVNAPIAWKVISSIKSLKTDRDVKVSGVMRSVVANDGYNGNVRSIEGTLISSPKDIDTIQLANYLHILSFLHNINNEFIKKVAYALDLIAKATPYVSKKIGLSIEEHLKYNKYRGIKLDEARAENAIQLANIVQKDQKMSDAFTRFATKSISNIDYDALTIFSESIINILTLKKEISKYPRILLTDSLKFTSTDTANIIKKVFDDANNQGRGCPKELADLAVIKPFDPKNEEENDFIVSLRNIANYQTSSK